MRPFNKTTATSVRTHPFSTLCPTPLGKLPVWVEAFSVIAKLRVIFRNLRLKLYPGQDWHQAANKRGAGDQ